MEQKKSWKVGWYIVSGLGIDVGGKVESGYCGDVGLEFGFNVGSRYEISLGKHFKGRVNVRLDDSKGWGYIIGVSNGVCRGVNG